MKAIQQIHQRLINQVEDLTGKSILDYGFGRGDMIELLLQKQNDFQLIFGVDSSEAFVESVKNRFENVVSKGRLVVELCSSPKNLSDHSFDVIFCHNVLECIADKQEFINNLFALLKPGGILLLSHHDFDSAIYNSSLKELSRNLIHCFADTKQDWQTNHDGQMGRKIPGILIRSGIKNVTFETWRMVENSFKANDYGFLMCKMILDVCKDSFSSAELSSWKQDLEFKAENKDFYFAIDVVVAKATQGTRV